MPSPHFIIAGERRSGSTSLYDILKRHPDVAMYHKPDFDYFIEPELFATTQISKDQPLASWDETHSLQKFQSFFDGLTGTVGQKNADILWWKPTHSRIAKMLPQTKFVFVLRDPVKRAYSQYCNEIGKGRETLSFKEAITREEKGNLSPWQLLHLTYKERGCYWKSLNSFTNEITADRIKIIVLEELFNQPQASMTSLCEFLDIDLEKGLSLPLLHTNKEKLLERNSFSKLPIISYIFDVWDRLSEAVIIRTFPDKLRRNKARKLARGFYYTESRKNRTINPEIEKELRAFYEPHNKKLEALFDVNISYWK